jgi:hypothetical protein
MANRMDWDKRLNKKNPWLYKTTKDSLFNPDYDQEAYDKIWKILPCNDLNKGFNTVSR